MPVWDRWRDARGVWKRCGSAVGETARRDPDESLGGIVQMLPLASPASPASRRQDFAHAFGRRWVPTVVSPARLLMHVLGLTSVIAPGRGWVGAMLLHPPRCQPAAWSAATEAHLSAPRSAPRAPGGWCTAPGAVGLVQAHRPIRQRAAVPGLAGREEDRAVRRRPGHSGTPGRCSCCDRGSYGPSLYPQKIRHRIAVRWQSEGYGAPIHSRTHARPSLRREGQIRHPNRSRTS